MIGFVFCVMLYNVCGVFVLFCGFLINDVCIFVLFDLCGCLIVREIFVLFFFMCFLF